ncbi:MAG: carboxypeptidase-like regulatory domain-containing protein [Flavobacteriales bacterium]
MRKYYLSLFVFLLATGFSMAQQGTGSIKGKVTDTATDEGVPFCNVIVYLNGNQMTGTTTDFDGNYTIKPIDAGTYDVEFTFVGYTPQRVNGVIVKSNRQTFLDQKMSESDGVDLEEAVVTGFKVPLIDKDGGASGGTVTREDLSKMPGRSAASIATTVAGVSSAGTDGLSIRGSRADGTFYYIDGIKVRGSTNLPKAALEEVSVITGGVPANYGDATGGIISITTRGASSFYFGGLDILSSGFKSGNSAVGLDKFGYNLVEGFISGPILFKKNEDGTKDRPLLGFFLSGNYNSQVDPRPTFDGVPYLRDDARQRLLDTPLIPNFADDGSIAGALYQADFLRASDIETLPTRQNVGVQRGSLSGKIDVTTTPTISLTFGGSGNYTASNNFSYDNMLMNTDGNAFQTNLDWRAYGRFSQRFENSQDTESNVKNIYYTFMVDYSQGIGRIQDQRHEEDFFKYGHVGTYDVTLRNFYALPDGGDSQSTTLIHDGFQEVYVDFTPSDFNPSLAAINSAYFSGLPQFQLNDQQIQNLINNPLANVPQGPYTSLNNVQAGNGLLNGQTVDQTYNLWNYLGTPNNNFGEATNNQFRVTGAGSADIGNHALQIGFEYEVRRDANYSLAPVGLWQIGRLYANSHITEVDANNIAEIGNFGSFTTIEYERLIGDNQFAFDRNLRLALGLDPDGNDFINIDGLDPEFFDLDFFSADDLLNQGNNLVSYFGYDHLGNKLSGQRPSIEDFFNETDENGYNTRPVGAYEPIYISGFVMDKFSFDDIIFNVGLRVDRFDANQPVLRDPYVVGRALTVGELLDSDTDVNIPGNISNDHVIYVDNVDDPSANSITGFRLGDDWFDSSGTPVDDPLSTLASSNGLPAPYLAAGGETELSSDAFVDYDPQVNIMPRIAFSFPISDEALFFAHYDVLTQRPTSSNRFDPIDYFFIETRNEIIQNPDLKPSRTVDYELGFQQVLTRTSSLKISAFYREMRDDIQVRNFVGAYPRQYRAFGNLDFGTVKGMTLNYDMRRTGNIRMNASYTLQFADGTGSDTQTALALVNAGLPNLRTVNPTNRDQRHRFVLTLDYRYGSKKDYNGPIVFGKPILADFGVNLVGDLGSGTPYTAQELATPITGEIAPATKGSLNGSRLPWIFNTSFQADKNFTLNLNKKEGDQAKTANLNVYLLVNNLLNIRNITSVYRFTGIADDDGWLVSPQAQQNINGQNDSEAFVDLYNAYIQNPFNLVAPRTIRLGLNFSF